MFSNLGLDYKILLLQSFNFLILFLVVYKFFSKPLFNILNKRKQEIEAAQNQLDKAKKIAKKILLLKLKIKKYIASEREKLKKTLEEEKNNKLKIIDQELAFYKENMLRQLAIERKNLKLNLENELKKESYDLFLTLSKKIFAKKNLDSEFINNIFHFDEKN